MHKYCCDRCGDVIPDVFTLCQPCDINENYQRIDKMIEEKLIPFDLEKALEGEPVITRDGMPILEIFYSKTLEKKGDQSVMAVADDGKTFHEKDGTFYPKKIPSDYDLFMAPKPKKFKWVNLYRATNENGITVYLGDFEHNTEKEAWEASSYSSSYIKTISFEV